MAALCIAVVAAEVVLRLLDYAPEEWDWHKTLIRLDAHCLYRIVGRSRSDINSLGYRDHEFDVAKAGKNRFLMLGDSFVFGDNLPPADTLPKVLERKLGSQFEVLNMGQPGYGPDQEYARLITDGFLLDPDGVILSIFAANDYADIFKDKLYVLNTEGEIEFNPRNPVALVLPFFRLATFLRRVTLGDFVSPEQNQSLNLVLGGDSRDLLADPSTLVSSQKIRLMDRMLVKFRDTLATHRGRLIVVVLPCIENIDHPFHVSDEVAFRNEDILAQICMDEGLECLNLKDAFRKRRNQGLFDPLDGHLSRSGVDLAAEELRRRIASLPQ